MICTPIVSSTEHEILNDIKIANRLADIIELRTDFFSHQVNINKIISTCKKPIIFTVRKSNNLKTIRPQNMLAMYSNAIDNKVDYIDIDFSLNIHEKIHQFLKKTKLILSYHDFKKTSKTEIQSVYKKISKFNPHLIKIVTFANGINDNLILYDLLSQSKKKMIAFSMGEYGQSSRILCLKFGSFLTYGSLSDNKQSAPGQITASDMKTIYNVKHITKKTKIFGLVGNPVNKSKGYIFHNDMFNKKKYDAVYVNFLADNFSKFFNSYKSLLSGLSVTMPFKEDADKLSPTQTGATNTIRISKDIKTFNTDELAALKLLSSKDKDVLVIGAGGVARAIVHGLITGGANVIIYNRTLSKAKALAQRFGCCYVDTIKNLYFDILINCTPIGMSPNTKQSPIKDKSILKDKLVMDLVHTPPLTSLLKQALSVNAKIITGEEFFLQQALEQQRVWTR